MFADCLFLNVADARLRRLQGHDTGGPPQALLATASLETRTRWRRQTTCTGLICLPVPAHLPCLFSPHARQLFHLRLRSKGSATPAWRWRSLASGNAAASEGTAGQKECGTGTTSTASVTELGVQRGKQPERRAPRHPGRAHQGVRAQEAALQEGKAKLSLHARKSHNSASPVVRALLGSINALPSGGGAGRY